MSRRDAIQLTGVAVLAAVVGVLLASDPSQEGQAKASGYYGGQTGQVSAPDGITVTGVGYARVSRPPERSDRTIGLAVAAAQSEAFPKAVADARRRAEALAGSLGLTVGSVESVAETGDTYSSGVFGRFGAGRHCGMTSRRIFGRDAAGRRSLRRVVRRRECVVPRQSAVTLAVRYEKG